MELVIVRHAIAADRGTAPYDRDEQRPLTPEGIRKWRRGAHGLARLVGSPEALYTSPLVRSVETAQILSEAWGGKPAPETADVLAPGMTPEAVVRWLRSLGHHERVVLVGHEPGCSELLSHLLVGRAALPLDFGKGGAALVDLDLARPRARATLGWFASPKLLRAAG